MPDEPDPNYDPNSATIPLSGPRPTLSGRDVDLPLPDELAKLLPAGAYEVTHFLGAGGMGAVYKGMQIRLKRPVAIKIMRRDMGKDHDFEARFEREAQAMAKLNHPNIVSVIDFGEAGPDYLFIVMELVDGTDLMEVIRSGQMTQEMALTLLPQICDALQFAHDHGIVHRDIKPSNIMLTRDGRVKMADFGLAKHFDSDSSFRTQTGTGMGTPDYAAPEQFDGHAPIDHRADIYALGVMIYQMITGQLPRGVWKPPSLRVEVDPHWDDIVSRAMQNDPADRYQQASEVKTDVSSIPLVGAGRAAGPSAAAKGPQAALGGPSALPRAKSRASLLLGLVGAAAISLGVFFIMKKPTPANSEAKASASSPASAPVSSDAQVSRTQVTASAIQWQKANWTEEDLKKKTIVADGDWARIGQKAGTPNGWAISAKGENVSFKDGVVRLRYRWEGGRVALKIRHVGSSYGQVVIWGQNLDLSIHIESPGGRVFEKATLPRPLNDGDEGTLEIAAIGKRLYARINNSIVFASPEIPELSPDGFCGVHSENGTFRDVEYAILDGISDPLKALGWEVPNAIQTALASVSPAVRPYVAYPERLKVPVPDWLRLASAEGGSLRIHTSGDPDPAKAALDLGEAARFDDFVFVASQDLGWIAVRRNGELWGQNTDYTGQIKTVGPIRIKSLSTGRNCHWLEEDGTAGSLYGIHHHKFRVSDWKSERVTAASLHSGVVFFPTGRAQRLAFDSVGVLLAHFSEVNRPEYRFPPADWFRGAPLPMAGDGMAALTNDGRVRTWDFTTGTSFPGMDEVSGVVQLAYGSSTANLGVLLSEVGQAKVFGPKGSNIPENVVPPADGGPFIRVSPGPIFAAQKSDGSWIGWNSGEPNLAAAVAALGRVISIASGRVVLNQGIYAEKPVPVPYLIYIQPKKSETSHPFGERKEQSADPIPDVGWNNLMEEWERYPDRVSLTERESVKRNAEGWRAAVDTGASATLNDPLGRDLAVRVTARFDPINLSTKTDPGFTVRARRTGPGKIPKQYTGCLFRSGKGDLRVNDGNSTDWRVLKSFEMPAGFDPWQPHTIEIATQKDLISFHVDGNLIASVRDATLPPGGRFGMTGNDGILLQKVEYRYLDSVPSPSSATKDTPFINTLGMKFVPVPITGGPTSGQRVLFSVWETRVQDYEVFAKETKREWPKPGFEQGPTHPAVNVTWEDTQAFCAWLTERERKAGNIEAKVHYRLPRDHEWSCAVRIGDKENSAMLPSEKHAKLKTEYPWGGEWPPPADTGNFSGEETLGREIHKPGQLSLKGYRDAFVATAPVGSFLPGSHGIFDLTGNVWEWCEDWFDQSHTLRVLRGNAWDGGERSRFLSSSRTSSTPVTRANAYGFRVVLELADDSQSASDEWAYLKDPALPTITGWEDMMANAKANLRSTGHVEYTEENGWVIAKTKSMGGSNINRSAIAGTAVRGRIRDSVGIHVRTNSGKSDVYYQVKFDMEDKAEISRRDRIGDGPSLKTVLSEFTTQSRSEHEFLIVMVGSELRVWVDGHLSAKVRDNTFSKGVVAMHFETAGSAVRDLAVAELPDDFFGKTTGTAQAQADPSTATKGAPFINTLGMKFVPVPITGGPTGGQRVLFSIWETRVKDYEVFVKEATRKVASVPFPQGPTHPALRVSWEDAQAFCVWLTDRERNAGKLGANESYRLPSDHEWSCAVGIGDREDPLKSPDEKSEKITEAFPWGSDWPPPPGMENYSGEETVGKEVTAQQTSLRGYRDDFAVTSPVGSFTANGFGLFDLGGNAREWCGDWLERAHQRHLLRGTSFNVAERKAMLSSARSMVESPNSYHSGGFRVVLVSDIPVQPATATKYAPFVNSLGMKFAPCRSPAGRRTSSGCSSPSGRRG